MIKLSDSLDVPQRAVDFAYEYQGGMQGFKDAIKNAFPELMFTNEEIRALVALSRAEREADGDVLALSSANGNLLSRKVDKVLDNEIDRIMRENAALAKIMILPDDQEYRVLGTNRFLSPGDAAEEYERNLKMILTIKKALTDTIKAQSPQTAVQINNGFDLGAIVGNAVKEIQERGICIT